MPWGPSPLTDACHDITTYPAIGLAAGACACEGNGILIDISGPAHPVRIDEVSDPNFAWHSATLRNDGRKVIFTDEWGGPVAHRGRARSAAVFLPRPRDPVWVQSAPLRAGVIRLPLIMGRSGVRVPPAFGR
jgi:hypothetical protein